MKRIIPFLLSIMVALAACGNNKGILNAPEVPVVEEEGSVVAKLAISKNKAGSYRNPRLAKLTVAKNPAMADGNRENPTGVLGAANAKVASFTLSIEAREQYQVPVLYVTPDLPNGTLGRVFRNMKIYKYDVQVGSTAGTLPDEIIEFRFGSTVSIKANSRYIVLDFRADIASDATAEDLATVNDYLNGPFIIWVDAQGTATGNYIQNRENISGQRVYITEHGSADVTIGSYSAIEPPHTLKPRVWNKVLKVGVEAGHGEDIIFPTVSLGIRMRDAEGHLIYNTNGIGGFRLVKDGVVIVTGNAPSGFDGLRRLDLSGVITLYPNSPVIVAAGSIWEGDIEIGINELAVPGYTIQLCLSSNLAIDAAFDLLPLGEVRGAQSSVPIITTIFGHDEWFVLGPEFTVGE